MEMWRECGGNLGNIPPPPNAFSSWWSNDAAALNVSSKTSCFMWFQDKHIQRIISTGGGQIGAQMLHDTVGKSYFAALPLGGGVRVKTPSGNTHSCFSQSHYGCSWVITHTCVQPLHNNLEHTKNCTYGSSILESIKVNSSDSKARVVIYYLWVT